MRVKNRIPSECIKRNISLSLSLSVCLSGSDRSTTISLKTKDRLTFRRVSLFQCSRGTGRKFANIGWQFGYDERWRNYRGKSCRTSRGFDREGGEGGGWGWNPRGRTRLDSQSVTYLSLSLSLSRLQSGWDNVHGAGRARGCTRKEPRSELLVLNKYNGRARLT